MDAVDFHTVFEEQNLAGALNIDELSFALIRESSSGHGISDSSFKDLLTVFGMQSVQRSDDFHSLTTAVWTDKDVFTKNQLEKIFSTLALSDFSGIDGDNSYSLYDMISNLFEIEQALDLLSKLRKHSCLVDASNYATDQLNRKLARR